MKKLIMIVNALLVINTVYGQMAYYNETGQISGNGFTYQCDKDEGMITLYNSNNRFVYKNCTYKDGSKLEDEVFMGYIPSVESDPVNGQRFFTIIRNGFTAAQKAAIGDYSLFVQAYIDPDTGRIADVEFRFGERTIFATFPVEVYYNIEQQLKAQQLYKMTEVGKKLNYGIDVASVPINPKYR